MDLKKIIIIASTHTKIIRTGIVKTMFNENTAPAKYSKVKLYIALYRGTIININNVVNTP